MHRRKQAQADPAEAHAARLAWWAAFLTTVALALAIGFVHTADAATLPASPLLPGSRALAFEPEEAEEDEEEAEPCEAEFADAEGTEEEEEEEEEEIGGEEECELVEEDETPPPSCKLESADAAVSADLVHRRLRLAVRYAAFKATPVAVIYFLRGPRGPLSLPVKRQRFGRSGVFRASEKLNRGQARRVAAARSFTVQVRPAGAPGFCREYLDSELTVRRRGDGGPIWTDSDSTFRHARHA